jgi:ABC-type bacteriocin/lantibiotic exporter with double-glycine peptidase domain
LDQPIVNPGNQVPQGGLSLELDEVTFSYAPDAPPAVSELSLRVQPGRRVALVGASGSGKSTAARLAVGLLTATRGAVLLDGIPVDECEPALRAKSLGYVEQEVTLFAGSVRENITLFDDNYPMHQVRAAATAAAIDRDIESRPGGYDAMVSDGGRNLSGGQRQRLELARVMLVEPGIVVLDEATSALDPIVEAQVMEALLATGAGLLIIAHRLSTVRDCDEIIVMSQGRIVERGTHEELISLNCEYSRLVASA